MDKYELTIKIDQLSKLMKNEDYVSAAKVAEQIEWKKIKQWTVMSNAIDAFIATGKYENARNVCIYAYNRRLGGRRLLATLMDMYIRLGEYGEAEEIYQEYVEAAPRDLCRYTLLYRLKRAQGAPVDELINILQEYKENELDEIYEYELAVLYSEAGLTDRCVHECDELVLWFADGEYAEKALLLKQQYAPLTARQSEQLARLERANAKKKESIKPAVVKGNTEDKEKHSRPETDAGRREPEYDRASYSTELTDIREDEADKQPEWAKLREETQVYTEQEPAAVMEEPEEGKKNKPAELEEKPEENRKQEHNKKPEENKKQEQNKKSKDEQEAEQAPKYIDNIGNTTEWSPIEVEKELEGDSETGAAVLAKTDMELIDDDYEINIKVPDYSVYDTRNVQQELKANVEEIMEAYYNREKKEELLEIQEPEQTAADANPTKEIIINKHQWRKASRNTADKETNTKVTNAAAHGQMTDITAGKTVMDSLTIEQMAAIVARLQAEQQAREKEAKENDQIKGQMDITQWLSELGEEQPGNKALSEAAAAVEEEPQKNYFEKAADMPEPEEAFEEIPEPEEDFEELTNVDELEEKAFEDISESKEGFEELPSVEESEDEALGKISEPERSLEKLSGRKEPEEKGFKQTNAGKELIQETAEEESLSDIEAAVNDGIERLIEGRLDSTDNGSNATVEAGEYALRPEERRFMEKYLYMSGMERRLCRYIGGLRRKAPDGTSSTGNAVIMGNRSTDKTAFAVNLFKALHAYDEKREHKMARISADRINAIGFGNIRDRIIGQTIVIENAGALRREQVLSMISFMDSCTQGALFILEDEEFNINKLFAENPDFSDKFSGRFMLKQYTVNELVDIAKDYADAKGWNIEDKALLKLYLILSRLPNDDLGDIVSVVKDIIERAGEHAKNRLGNKLFGHFRSVLFIKESDLDVLDEEDEDEGEDNDDSEKGISIGKYSKDTYEEDDYDDEEDDE